MAWGDAAAEQHEKDQPSTCVRPDGVKPELEPIKDREDFATRMRHLLGKRRLFADVTLQAGHETYAESRIRALDAEMDQLVLMRAAQILDEAEDRRKSVMRKLGTIR